MLTIKRTMLSKLTPVKVRLVLPLIVLLALPFGLVAWASGQGDLSDVSAWVQDWTQQTRTTDYAGTVLIAGNGGTQAFDLWHQYRDGEERERLRRRDGPLLEIDRVDDELTCVHGPDADIPEDHALPGSPFAQLLHMEPDQVAAHYAVSHLGRDRVANRNAEAYELVHREDPELHQHRVWLDSDTRVLLRYQIVSADGEMLSEARFTDIRYDDVDFPRSLAERFADSFWHRFKAHSVTSSSDAGSVWSAGWMPAGFSAQVEERRGDGWYQLWSDGVVKLSIMVDPIGQDQQPLNASQRQGGDAMVAQAHDQWQVVVVGAVPMATAERIASGISWE